jgi:hypothetical protein
LIPSLDDAIVVVSAASALRIGARVMVQGLQFTIRGEELTRRIGERLAVHENELATLEARVKRRDGDQPYDIRVDDGLDTFGELLDQRNKCRQKVWELRLYRDTLLSGDTYTLSLGDLRAARLIGVDANDPNAEDDVRVRHQVIDGLRLTMCGVDLHRHLDDRVRAHEGRAKWWKHEQTRTDDETEDSPIMPEHICENEAEREEWRAAVLGFIRDRIDPLTTYRLAESDFELIELLPEKPGWLEQEEYELGLGRNRR